MTRLDPNLSRLVAALLALALAGPAYAQDDASGEPPRDEAAADTDTVGEDEETVPTGRDYTTSAFEDRRRESPEYLAWELLRVGIHTPNFSGDAFDRFFGGDLGPMIATEFDFLPLRIPYVGRFGVGVGFGWSEYSGQTCVAPDCTTQTDESTDLRLLPLSALGVLRVDVLSRRFNVPLLVTAKIGMDAIFFRIDTGGSTTSESVSLGLRWAVQAAFELDIINPRAAHALDQEWGINHSFLFFELYGSTANDPLPVGTDLSWAAGLGLSM